MVLDHVYKELLLDYFAVHKGLSGLSTFRAVLST